VKSGQASLLFATALLDEIARDEQLEAMRQMMIESRAIADAAELDYLDYRRAVELARQLQQTVPDVTSEPYCSRRCLYFSGNCPRR